MKAIALNPKSRTLQILDVPEPEITQPDQVKVHVLQVGICGTDREEARGERGDAPAGEENLIIGHEMLGKVVEVGSDVHSVKTGDFAIFTVRRGCGKCMACRMSRPDMCYTGDYKERGIKGLNGYQTEYVVDHERFLIHVPSEIAQYAVLTEPMSVVEKAIDEAVRVQVNRLPDTADPSLWLRGKRVLVAGLGPIGLLATMALRLRGAHVLGLDIVDKNTARPKLLKKMGGEYIDGRELKTETLQHHCGQIDVILEATGVAKLDFDLIEALGVNGVIVLTGVPGGHRCIDIDGATLMQHLVLKNQVMIGSVNASQAHFQRAVDDLIFGSKTWPEVLPQMITSRVPYKQVKEVLSSHPVDEIKTIIQWATF